MSAAQPIPSLPSSPSPVPPVLRVCLSGRLEKWCESVASKAQAIRLWPGRSSPSLASLERGRTPELAGFAGNPLFPLCYSLLHTSVSLWELVLIQRWPLGGLVSLCLSAPVLSVWDQCRVSADDLTEQEVGALRSD